MSILYKSERVGKNGRVFPMLKFRTLKKGSDKQEFANGDSYTRWGKFLRKYKIDESPQLLNVLKGDMTLFGYRPEEPRTFYRMPEALQTVFLKHKPGIIDLASLHFMDEEHLLQMSGDATETYWTKIKPLKITLQFFYFEHKSWLMNLAILWGFFKRIVWGQSTNK